MDRDPENLVYHELIGLTVHVISHSDPTLTGLSGRVVDETMNMLKLRVYSGRVVNVPKRYGVFLFLLPDGCKAVVDGSQIIGRPEDRLKRLKELIQRRRR